MHANGNRGLAMVVFVGALIWAASASAAEGSWLDCVYPKTRLVAKHLVFVRPVFIYERPDPASKRLRLKLFEAFYVAAEKDGFYRIAGGADAAPDFTPRVAIGWVKKTDFDSLPFRNCN